MEKMSELLEKYFRGETSLAEENELKKYILSGTVKPEHAVYLSLFEAFSQEKNDFAVEPLKKIMSRNHRLKYNWVRIVSYSGIAAALVLALWVQLPHRSEDFAIISGKRIDNTEYAQRYATAKLNKVNDILKNSMEPLQSLNKVKKALKPLRTIPNLKNETIE